MGLHSTLFGPVKYAILPQHLQRRGAGRRQRLVEMGTFVAILIGTIVGGVLVALPGGGAALASPRSSIAVARRRPHRRGASCRARRRPTPASTINWNPLTETWTNLGSRARNRTVFLSMLGISWFWFFGAMFLTQFPDFAKERAGRRRAAS